MDTPPRVKDEEIVIAADDGLGAGGEGKLQILVVLCIAAIGYPHDGIEPDGSISQNSQQTVATRERNGAREFRPTDTETG